MPLVCFPDQLLHLINGMSADESTITKDLVECDGQQACIIDAQKHEAILLHLFFGERSAAAGSDSLNHVFYLLLFVICHSMRLLYLMQDMTDGVIYSWPCKCVCFSPNTIVVFA